MLGIESSTRGWTPLWTQWTFFLVLALFPTSVWSSTRFQIQALYGLDGDFWDTAETLHAKKRDPSTIADLLDSKFENPQEGIASIGLRYYGDISSSFEKWFSHGYLGVGGDGLAGGSIRNRIMPELRGYSVVTAHADVGMAKEPELGTDGLDYLFGSTVGGGEQKLVQGSALEFLDHVPARQSALFYAGVDAEVGGRMEFSDALSARNRLILQPTFFHSDSSDSGYEYKIRRNSLYLRWRFENQWQALFGETQAAGGAVGLYLLSGQQPIPDRVLPRTWDSIHDINTFPAFGQLIGVGTQVRFHFSDPRYFFRLDGGFYGGYFGGGAHLGLSSVGIFAGTYGLEQTPGYRLQESRIKYVGLQIRANL